MHFSNFFLLSSLYNPHVAATSRKFITSFYYVCLCATCVPGTQRGQKLDSLELQLQAVASFLLLAGH